jgi:hypothetical protein
MSNKEKPSFSSSYINRFTKWIEGLPGSSWGYYVGFTIFLLSLQTVASWVEGAIPIGSFLPEHIFLSAAISFIIAIIPYFDKRALAALETIKPSLTIDEAKLKELAYQLTHLPAFKSILASIIVLIISHYFEFVGEGAYQNAALIGFPISMYLSRVIYLICWWFFGLFLYHTIHQLGLINKIYNRYTRIDLFRMHPLYGFSNLAAFTSGAIIMLPYGFLFITPAIKLNNPVILILYLVISIIPVVTFILPQLGLYRLQTAEKKLKLDEIDQRYKNVLDEVNNCVDNGEHAKIANLNSSLSTLSNVRQRISKISTWPWQPETIRWLFTALVLPLLMWIAQYFLSKWL